MPRRVHPPTRNQHYPPSSIVTGTDPYQLATLCNHQRVPSLHQPKHHYHTPNQRPRNGYYSDDTTFTTDYYEHINKENKYSDRSVSDESGSTRHDIESYRRYPRDFVYSSTSRSKDIRRIFPQVEIVTSRPQSSNSSNGLTSTAIVDGCGGKCQTFENVCYFILQLIFMMAILIGISLSIAGLALRKSAAKNLQVLVYIGALLAIVSGGLLGIQWKARSSMRRRKMALRNAKRGGPIPLETLNNGRNQHVVQPLMTLPEGQRVVPQILRPVSFQQDQQGTPWWRRKDIV